MKDRLIRADDALRHYESLKRVGKAHLATVRVFDGLGHCDVNYKQAEALQVGIQDELRNGIDQTDLSNNYSFS